MKVYLQDEAKLRAFREVAEEALRGRDDSVPGNNLGLPVEEGAVRGDAVTYIDAVTRSATGEVVER